MPVASSSRARLMAQEANQVTLDPALAAAGAEAQAAQAATPLDSLTTVLGSANGATLRQIARDLDSTRLLLDLAAPAGRPARRLAVQATTRDHARSREITRDHPRLDPPAGSPFRSSPPHSSGGSRPRRGECERLAARRGVS